MYEENIGSTLDMELKIELVVTVRELVKSGNTEVALELMRTLNVMTDNDMVCDDIGYDDMDGVMGNLHPHEDYRSIYEKNMFNRDLYSNQYSQPSNRRYGYSDANPMRHGVTNNQFVNRMPNTNDGGFKTIVTDFFTVVQGPNYNYSIFINSKLEKDTFIYNEIVKMVEETLSSNHGFNVLEQRNDDKELILKCLNNIDEVRVSHVSSIISIASLPTPLSIPNYTAGELNNVSNALNLFSRYDEGISNHSIIRAIIELLSNIIIERKIYNHIPNEDDNVGVAETNKVVAEHDVKIMSVKTENNITMSELEIVHTKVVNAPNHIVGTRLVLEEAYILDGKVVKYKSTGSRRAFVLKCKLNDLSIVLRTYPRINDIETDVKVDKALVKSIAMVYKKYNGLTFNKVTSISSEYVVEIRVGDKSGYENIKNKVFLVNVVGRHMVITLDGIAIKEKEFTVEIYEDDVTGKLWVDRSLAEFDNEYFGRLNSYLNNFNI